MKEKKIYTLDDIAKELGVSKTTVSRVISGKGRIGKETRERVQKFIIEHDYQPNVVAKGLAQKKTYNIGLVLPLDYAAKEFPFFKDCMNGICRLTAKYNYDVIISMCDGENLEPVKRLVANRKVDGMILSRAIEDSSAQEYFKESGMPYVVIGPVLDQETLHVDNNNEDACKELTLRLLEKDDGKVALLGGKKSHSVTQSRYQGFIKAHYQMGKGTQDFVYISDINSQTDAETAVDKVMNENIKKILCMDDFITELVLTALRKKKIKLPEEMKLASCYDSRQLEKNNPPVTAIKFDTVQLGANACSKLLEVLGEDTEECIKQADYEILVRSSTD